jgi:hypothetical protein
MSHSSGGVGNGIINKRGHGPAKALWRGAGEWLIAPRNRAAEQPSTGIAQPDRAEVGHLRNRITAKRRYHWLELGDDAYARRYARLSTLWHPAIAAIMAHDVASGPGATKRRGSPRREGTAPAVRLDRSHPIGGHPNTEVSGVA